MNVYEVTTQVDEQQKQSSYIAANCLIDVFKHTNEDWQQSVIEVKQVLANLTYGEVMEHPWPMSMVI